MADAKSKGWVYSQSTGELSLDGEHVAIGYSGAGAGKNNPGMQQIPNKGPVPQSQYEISTPYKHPTKGPVVMHLTPINGTETFGRSKFLIHGDSISHPGKGSEGCIVVGPAIRSRMAISSERIILVVP